MFFFFSFWELYYRFIIVIGLFVLFFFFFVFSALLGTVPIRWVIFKIWLLFDLNHHLTFGFPLTVLVLCVLCIWYSRLLVGLAGAETMPPKMLNLGWRLEVLCSRVLKILLMLLKSQWVRRYCRHSYASWMANSVGVVVCWSPFFLPQLKNNGWFPLIVLDDIILSLWCSRWSSRYFV